MRCIYLLLLIVCNSLQGISQSLTPERIAICDFQVLTKQNDLTNYKWLEQGFAESLSDAFSRIDKYLVVERSQLNKVLEEQHLQINYINDTIGIVKAGKVLGVRKILIGSCQIYTGHFLVNMRIVDVESGKVSPLENLPIIKPLDSVLFVQKVICQEILKFYNVAYKVDDLKAIEQVTVSSTKSFKAYTFLSLGIELLNNNQLDDALTQFNLALEEDKKYGKAYYKRGLLNFRLSNYENARNDFSNSTMNYYLKKDSVFLLISHTYAKQGNREMAVYYFNKAKKINSKINESYLKILEEKTGTPLIPPKFETVFEYKNGMAKVKNGDKYGFIDTSEKVIIPIVYDEIGDFLDGLAPVRIGKKWGFLNLTGEIVINPEYSTVSPFNKFGLATVSINYNHGVINKNGKIVIPVKFDNIRSYFFYGLPNDSIIVVSKAKNIINPISLYGAYNIFGKLIIPLDYDELRLRPYSEGIRIDASPLTDYIYAKYKGKWGVINRRNQVVVAFTYDCEACINGFYNGFSTVKVNEKWGVVDQKGIQIIKPKFEHIKDFMNGLFLVKVKEKWGGINTANDTIIPIVYDEIDYLNNGYWQIKLNGKYGIADSKNGILSNPIYEELSYVDLGFWIIKLNGRYGLANSKKVICDPIYDDYNRNVFIRYPEKNQHKLVIRFKKDGAIFDINENCEKMNP